MGVLILTCRLLGMHPGSLLLLLWPPTCTSCVRMRASSSQQAGQLHANQVRPAHLRMLCRQPRIVLCRLPQEGSLLGLELAQEHGGVACRRAGGGGWGQVRRMNGDARPGIQQVQVVRVPH